MGGWKCDICKKPTTVIRVEETETNYPYTIIGCNHQAICTVHYDTEKRYKDNI